MKIVTMPGSRMMARRCFSIGVTRCYQALLNRSDSETVRSCPSGSMIMGTAVFRQGGDIYYRFEGIMPCRCLRLR